MDHHVDPLHRPRQPLLVPHVPDEVADLGVALGGELLRHLEPLELVAGENDQSLDLGEALEGGLDEPLPKRTRTAGHQNRTLLEHHYQPQ
ncbi:hypothetical protein D3C86_1268500 [compost metagenome]